MKFPVLVSYAYARKDLKGFQQIVEHPHCEVLLDSGAFTAKSTGEEITLDEYCNFLDEWGDKIFRYLALDVVGDPKGTDANLKEMLKNGYRPVPVHVLGDEQKRMDQLFELSDYVALAGLRRPGKGHCPREYIKQKMEWAAGRQVHWLGYVRDEMIQAFQPYSCDSASFQSAEIWGLLMVYASRGRWVGNFRYHKRMKALEDPVTMKLVQQFGFTVEDYHDRDCWKRSAKDRGWGNERFLSNIISYDSWVRYVIDVQRKFGTRIFLASSLGGGVWYLLNAIDHNAKKLYLDSVSV